MKGVLNALILTFFLSLTLHVVGQNKDNRALFLNLENGTTYSIKGFSGGEMPVWNDYIRMSLEKYSSDGELIFSTNMLDATNGVEMELRPDVWDGDITHVFQFMRKGDSATAYVPVWVADKDSSNKDINAKYRYEIVLHDFTRRCVFEARKAERLKELKTIENKVFEPLLVGYASRKIIRDSSGVIVIKTKEKAFTSRLKAGEKVNIHYVLQLLPDKKILDNSYTRGESFRFSLGQGDVIKGWDIALQYLSVGEKATLLIPSWMGYGERGAGRDIPADTPLLFEVEVLP